MRMKGKGRFRLLTILLITVLIAVAAVSIASQPGKSAQAAGTAPSGLHVVGNKIEDGSGHVIVPHGVDRMGGEYSCLSAGASTFDGPVDQASVSAMLTWGVTIVRVPLNEDCWLGINGEPANGTSAAQYQAAIMNWVNLLNQNGLIVILDLHWTNSGTNIASGQQSMPDLNHAPAFWTSVANTFKSNSSVIFDLFNEPFVTSWSCWLQGSTAPQSGACSGVGFAVAGMQTLVNTVRATGATNILMLGGLAYSNDLSGWLANKPTDPLNNLAASTHIYNFNACANTSCWNSQIAPVAAQVPVIAGEIGENDCASGFINTLMPWLDQHGIGYLAWSWSPYSCTGTPALITDYTGTPTAYGQGYKTHLLSLVGSIPTPPPSTPTPTPTSTPRPTPTPGTTPTPTATPRPTPTPGVTPTPSGGGACSVHYVVQNQWPGGFTTYITVTNTGSSAINGWSLKFTFPATQAVSQGWNATFSQSGEQVTVQNMSYNSSIPVNGSVSPGFNGTWNGSNPSPTAFTLNGASCSVS
jgi:Cellulose binding domain/Cellulase (glycosyl hydrolase family 5)